MLQSRNCDPSDRGQTEDDERVGGRIPAEQTFGWNTNHKAISKNRQPETVHIPEVQLGKLPNQKTVHSS